MKPGKKGISLNPETVSLGLAKMYDKLIETLGLVGDAERLDRGCRYSSDPDLYRKPY
jgi:hypothetical protein